MGVVLLLIVPDDKLADNEELGRVTLVVVRASTGRCVVLTTFCVVDTFTDDGLFVVALVFLLVFCDDNVLSGVVTFVAVSTIWKVESRMFSVVTLTFESFLRWVTGALVTADLVELSNCVILRRVGAEIVDTGTNGR